MLTKYCLGMYTLISLDSFTPIRERLHVSNVLICVGQVRADTNSAPVSRTVVLFQGLTRTQHTPPDLLHEQINTISHRKDLQKLKVVSTLFISCSPCLTVSMSDWPSGRGKSFSCEGEDTTTMGESVRRGVDWQVRQISNNSSLNIVWLLILKSIYVGLW